MKTISAQELEELKALLSQASAMKAKINALKKHILEIAYG